MTTVSRPKEDMIRNELEKMKIPELLEEAENYIPEIYSEVRKDLIDRIMEKILEEKVNDN